MNFGLKRDLNYDVESGRLRLSTGVNQRGSLITFRARTIWKRNFVLMNQELNVLRDFHIRFNRKTREFERFSTEIDLFSALLTDSLLIVRLCKTIETLVFVTDTDWTEIRKETDILNDFKGFLMGFEDFWIEKTDLRQ